MEPICGCIIVLYLEPICCLGNSHLCLLMNIIGNTLKALPLLLQVGDCLGTLAKTFKTYFLPFFDELSMYLTPMLVSEK